MSNKIRQIRARGASPAQRPSRPQPERRKPPRFGHEPKRTPLHPKAVNPPQNGERRPSHFSRTLPIARARTRPRRCGSSQARSRDGVPGGSLDRKTRRNRAAIRPAREALYATRARQREGASALGLRLFPSHFAPRSALHLETVCLPVEVAALKITHLDPLPQERFGRLTRRLFGAMIEHPGSSIRRAELVEF